MAEDEIPQGATFGPGQWDIDWDQLQPYELLGVEIGASWAEVESGYESRIAELDGQRRHAATDAERAEVRRRRAVLDHAFVKLRAAAEGTSFAVTGEVRGENRFSLGAALVGAVIVAGGAALVVFLLLATAR